MLKGESRGGDRCGLGRKVRREEGMLRVESRGREEVNLGK